MREKVYTPQHMVYIWYYMVFVFVEVWFRVWCLDIGDIYIYIYTVFKSLCIKFTLSYLHVYKCYTKIYIINVIDIYIQ